jgi:hypothetical protein
MSTRRMSSGKNKRKAEAANAPASEPTSYRKRTRLPMGALDEDDQPHVVMAEQIKKRELFEKISTELIRSWLMDYGNWKDFCPDADNAGREIILGAVVMHAMLPQGNSFTAQLKKLQGVWKRKNPNNPITPGEFIPPAADAQIISAPAPVRAINFGDISIDADNGGNSPHIGERSIGVADLDLNNYYSDPNDTGDDQKEEEIVRPIIPKFTPIKSAEKSIQRGHSTPVVINNQPQKRDFRNGCFSCLEIPLATDVSPAGEWNCKNKDCMLRGDWETDHPTNMLRINQRLAAINNNNAGQSTPPRTQSNSSASEPKLDKLEEYLNQIMVRNKDTIQPMFSIEKGPVTPVQMIEKGGNAYGASELKFPIEQLITLIQRGQLENIAFAVPRPINYLSSQSDKVDVLEFTNGQAKLSNKASDPTKPPPLADPIEFCMALLSTILPALIDRPQAAGEWHILGRTVLQIYKTNNCNWDIANRYLTSVLARQINSRTNTDSSNYCPFNLQILQEIQSYNPNKIFNSQTPRGILPQHSGSSVGGGNNFCHDWNGDKGCTRVSCKFPHKCAVCSGSHAAMSGASPECKATMIMRNNSKKNKSRSIGSASVRTNISTPKIVKNES